MKRLIFSTIPVTTGIDITKSSWIKRDFNLARQPIVVVATFAGNGASGSVEGMGTEVIFSFQTSAAMDVG
jgi:hypothetical protein